MTLTQPGFVDAFLEGARLADNATFHDGQGAALAHIRDELADLLQCSAYSVPAPARPHHHVALREAL